MITDRGTAFRSSEFKDYLKENNIDMVNVAVASPHTNGQVERVNRVIKPMLGKLSESISHANWAHKLQDTEYALNNSVHSTTRKTPSEMLFGVNQRGKLVDELIEYLDELREPKSDLVGIRQEALKAIERAQDYAAHRASIKNKPAKEYEVGDFVVILNVDTTVGSSKKFIPRYRGPYVVHKIIGHDRYVIRDVENCQLTQLPYDGVVEANRMRKWFSPLAAAEINRRAGKSDTERDEEEGSIEGSDETDGSSEDESSEYEDFAGFNEFDISDALIGADQ